MISRGLTGPERFDRMLSAIKNFFSTVQGSIQGILVPEEVYRSILTALGSGSTVGVLILLLQSVLSDASTIFPNPTVATLASMLITLILDLLRRQSQGGTPTPAPTPAPIPGPSPAPQAS